MPFAVISGKAAYNSSRHKKKSLSLSFADDMSDTRHAGHILNRRHRNDSYFAHANITPALV